MNTLPLANYRNPGDPVLLRSEGALPAGAFFSQARRLAEALPPGLPGASFVINLCESRHAFMLGFAAALMGGRTSLLPPGRGRADRESLLAQYPGACVLSDMPQDADAFDLTAFLGQAAHDATDAGIPRLADDRVAAILFTSGSTGRPAAHPKTWAQLRHGAAHLAQALGWAEGVPPAVIGSIPPQHMFGLEATVMLPWHSGAPVHAGRPLLAADIETALRECAQPAWWMTTPVQLRATLKAPGALPGLRGILASTMNLPAALANAAESAWQVPVMEIYGSTETGAMAIRRSAAEAAWRPLPGVSLRREGEGDARTAWASGPHIGDAVRLDDALEFQPDGRFVWLGRASDLVKVGGRRASLAALNLALAEIPGVDDAAYVAPGVPGDESHSTRRLAALYVSATLAPQDVLEALRARIDPAFLPRPLHRVAALPRNPLGKLAQSALARLLEECAQRADPARRMEAHAGVPASHPAIPGHFPGRPLVPGVVILARVTDALRAQWPQLEPATLLAARFHAPLAPGQAFSVSTRLQGAQARFEVRAAKGPSGVDGTLVASGLWACRPVPGGASLAA